MWIKRERDMASAGSPAPDAGPMFVSDDEGGPGAGPSTDGSSSKTGAGVPGKKRRLNPAARRRAKRRREKEEAKAMGYTKATVFVGQRRTATAAQLKEYSHRGS